MVPKEKLRMNTNKLLMAAAAAALIAGTSGAVAQEHGGAAEKAAPKAPAGEIHQNARPAMPAKPAPGPAAQNRGEQRNAGRPETTGQAPAQQNEPRERATDEKRGGQNRAVEDRRNAGRPETSGQAPAQNEPRERATDEKRGGQNRAVDERRNENRNVREGEGTQPENRPENRGAREDERRTTSGQGAASSRERLNANITPERRTQIRNLVINEHGAPRVDHVDFDLAVGTRVPRAFHIVEVPTAIYDIEPAWRGFDYFMVADQLVIVDPRTLEILAVIDV
jgi:Protein of unknown function (DUF1236)